MPRQTASCKHMAASREEGCSLRWKLEICCQKANIHHIFSTRKFYGLLNHKAQYRLAEKSCISVCIPKACVYNSLQSCLTLCDPMDCVFQAPWSIRFSKQEYCSGLPCPPPDNLHEPGIEPTSLTSPPLTGRFFITSTTWEAPAYLCSTLCGLMYCSLPSSSVYGISQTRLLEWVATSFSRRSS